MNMNIPLTLTLSHDGARKKMGEGEDEGDFSNNSLLTNHLSMYFQYRPSCCFAGPCEDENPISSFCHSEESGFFNQTT